MIDAIERDGARDSDDRQIGGWQVVAAAWALLLLFLLLAEPGGVEQENTASPFASEQKRHRNHRVKGSQLPQSRNWR